MSNLNCTQFQSNTIERLERNGVDLKSAGALHVLSLAQLMDSTANDVYDRLQRVKRETDRRLHVLGNDDCLNEDAALHLGEAMDQFSQDAQRAETLAAQMKLGRKMLQFSIQSVIDQVRIAAATEKASA